MCFDALYDEILNISCSAYHTRSKQRLLYAWQRISPLIRSGDKAVEIGVGPMSAIIKRLTCANVIGIDLNYDQSALCEAFDIDLRLCDIQADALPLEKESVDLVLLLEVIEHLCAYPNDILDMIYDKLRIGGYLVVSTVNFLRISSRIRAICGKNPLVNYFERSEDGRNHIREYTVDEMVYYMEKSLFNIEKTYRFGIPSGSGTLSFLLRLAYVNPKFKNYFIIINKKQDPVLLQHSSGGLRE